MLHRPIFRYLSGFKHLFIAEILTSSPVNSQVNFTAWVASRPRSFGRLVFIDVVDSTGKAQVVVEFHHLSTARIPTAIRDLRPESSVHVHGTIVTRDTDGHDIRPIEIRAHGIDIISAACGTLALPIRRHNPGLLSSDKILSNRHIYLRNPILLAIGKFRSDMLYSMHKWFHSHSFVEISTPLITSSILYEPQSAIPLGGPLAEGKKSIFLSQCAGFYLEAAAHAHERVYNLGPSFRNESRTNRHLMEYWHVKAELTSGTLDDIMSLVEIFLRDIRSDCERLGIQTASSLGNVFPDDFTLPFPRITYLEAQQYLSTTDEVVEFGQNISNHHERMLTERFCSSKSPLWITHKPRALEPFPYAINPYDTRLTMTADLVAPDGFGEICGVAEKSYRLSDLDERLREKGKEAMEEYEWVRDMRHYGMVPHVAFGMGFERVIRWWIGVKHVKDTIPFPRVFGRAPLP